MTQERGINSSTISPSNDEHPVESVAQHPGLTPYRCNQCLHRWESKPIHFHSLSADVQALILSGGYDRSFIREVFNVGIAQLPDTDPIPGRCPQCRSVRWNLPRQEPQTLICQKCQYEWQSKIPNPKTCPNCKTRAWDGKQSLKTNPIIPSGTPRRCRRCGHHWISHLDRLPQTCPVCKSRLWNTPKSTQPQPSYTCIRCGHEWTGIKPTPPNYCPKCHSPFWNKERQIRRSLGL